MISPTLDEISDPLCIACGFALHSHHKYSNFCPVDVGGLLHQFQAAESTEGDSERLEGIPVPAQADLFETPQQAYEARERLAASWNPPFRYNGD